MSFSRSLLPLAPVLMALACPAALALAQGVTYTSYTQDTVKETNGTYASFGATNSAGTADEATFQQMIPAQYLVGTGAPILGMEVVANFSGNVTYSSLRITLAHTTTATLSRTFAVNLASNASVVLGGNDVTLTFVRNGWGRVNFATPFFYDGQSNLVIEIRKVIDRVRHPPLFPGLLTMQTRGDPPRFDLPQQVYDFGGFGSGVSQAGVSRLGSVYPMTTRLVWGGSPTIVLQSDPGGSTANGATFALGTTYDHTIQGRPGAPYVNLFSVGFAATPLAHPLLSGLGYLDLGRSITLTSAAIGAGGSSTLSLPIPLNTRLVGLQPTFQSVVLDSGLLLWTNAADEIVHN